MTNYYRPQSLEEALALLKNPNAIPLAGGTYINAIKRDHQYDLVDLQNLGLDKIYVKNKKIEIGSTVKLEQLGLSKNIPNHLRTAIKLEAPLNIRNSASVGGLLFACKGRSPVATSLLALDAMVILEPNHKEFLLSDFFSLRSDFPKGSIVTSIILPDDQRFTFNFVARTPFDLPIVCAALATRKNGRARLALGGYGNHPMLVIDGDISDDISAAAFSAYSDAEDEWASAEYRSDMAKVLSNRCLAILKPEV